jgi:D-amino-acid dehydrogenase
VASGGAASGRTDPDVLVIGGGVVGLFCAYFLSLAGAAVTVAERGPVGGPQSCSAANTGFVGTQGVAPLASPGVITQGLRWLAGRRTPFAISLAPSSELGSWLWQFHRLCTEADARTCAAVLLDMKKRSLEILREVCAGGPLKDTFAERGMIIAFKTASGFDQARAAMPHALARGVPLRELSRDQLAALEPGVEFDVHGALFNAEGAAVRTPDFVTALAALAEQAGAEVLPHTEVTCFETVGSRLRRVRTSRVDFTPGEVVIAAGTGSVALARALGIWLLLQPAKGYTVTARAPAAAPQHPVLLSEGKVAVLPLGDQLRVGGTLELGARSMTISRSRVAGITATVRDYLPGLEIPASREVWAGLRPCTPGSLPFLGRAGQFRNVTVASGHGYIGMGLAPVSARLITQVLCGERPEMDMTPLRADRVGCGRVGCGRVGCGRVGRARRDGGPR